MTPKITYLGHTITPAPAITFAASGRRYTYKLPHTGALESILYMLRRVTVGKAFAHAKRIGRLQ